MYLRHLWNNEKGGLDYVQVMIAMLIVSIAAVSTVYSIYVGRASLTQEYQEKQALRYAREEMEYWCGRLLGDTLSSVEKLGDLQGGRRVLIDPRDPQNASDNLWGRVFYSPIIPTYLMVTGEDIRDYYSVHVWVIWPYGRSISRDEQRRIDLYSSMISRQ